MKKLSLALLLSVSVQPVASANPCAQACAAMCAAAARCQDTTCAQSATDAVDTEECMSACAKALEARCQECGGKSITDTVTTKTGAIKGCPYSDQGLTWDKATESNVVFIQMERLSATHDAWEYMVNTIKEGMPNLPLTMTEEEGDYVVYRLDRGTMTQDAWLKTIAVLMSAYKEVKDMLDTNSKCCGAQMAVYVNRVD